MTAVSALAALHPRATLLLLGEIPETPSALLSGCPGFLLTASCSAAACGAAQGSEQLQAEGLCC